MVSARNQISMCPEEPINQLDSYCESHTPYHWGWALHLTSMLSLWVRTKRIRRYTTSWVGTRLKALDDLSITLHISGGSLLPWLPKVTRWRLEDIRQYVWPISSSLGPSQIEEAGWAERQQSLSSLYFPCGTMECRRKRDSKYHKRRSIDLTKTIKAGTM